MRTYPIYLLPITMVVIVMLPVLGMIDTSSNTKIIQNEKPKYGKISENNRIVCDDRGYAYYEYTDTYKYSLTPIFDNGIVNIQQVKCK